MMHKVCYFFKIILIVLCINTYLCNTSEADDNDNVSISYYTFDGEQYLDDYNRYTYLNWFYLDGCFLDTKSIQVLEYNPPIYSLQAEIVLVDDWLLFKNKITGKKIITYYYDYDEGNISYYDTKNDQIIQLNKNALNGNDYFYNSIGKLIFYHNYKIKCKDFNNNQFTSESIYDHINAGRWHALKHILSLFSILVIFLIISLLVLGIVGFFIQSGEENPTYSLYLVKEFWGTYRIEERKENSGCGCAVIFFVIVYATLSAFELLIKEYIQYVCLHIEYVLLFLFIVFIVFYSQKNR